MRVIIIVDDSLVAINGEFITGVDMSSMGSDIHAVQWYEDHGEIEYKDGRPNEFFTDISRFSNVIALFEEKRIEIKRNSPPNEYSDWDEMTTEWIENPTKKTAWEIRSQVEERKRYLNSTDWYYARLQEIGVPVPEDVVVQRIAAREYIQEHEEPFVKNERNYQ